MQLYSIFQRGKNNPVLNIIRCLVGALIVTQSPLALSTPDPLVDLPAELEFELALSALPAHLRENATVYHLNPYQGYEMVRHGNNGFHAFIARTSSSIIRGSWSFSTYPKDLLIPIAYDSAGQSANMQPLFDIAAMRANGFSAVEAKQAIKQNYHNQIYRAPQRTGLVYMLSPVLRTYADPDKSDTVVTLNIPHYMFYAPKVKHNAEIGGQLPPTSHPFLFQPGIHGTIVHNAGKKETQAINKEFKHLIKRVCKINKNWCVKQKH